MTVEQGVTPSASEESEFTSSEFRELIVDWCQRFPIVSIEDPMAETWAIL